jgi:hypothetical protein
LAYDCWYYWQGNYILLRSYELIFSVLKVEIALLAPDSVRGEAFLLLGGFFWEGGEEKLWFLNPKR